MWNAGCGMRNVQCEEVCEVCEASRCAVRSAEFQRVRATAKASYLRRSRPWLHSFRILHSALEKYPRTRRRTLTQNGHEVAGSDQALLQHTGISTYGCFLPDLTGFGGIPLSRTQPSTPRAPHLTKEQSALGREFDLAKADCEYRTPLVSRLARVKSVENGSTPHPFQRQTPP